MKIIILGNQARSMGNFWLILAKKLLAAQHEVIWLAPYPLPGDDPLWEARLVATGARLEHYKLDRKGLNPLKDVATLCHLYSFFATEKPDILFASTIKPIVYGAIASALARFPLKKNRHLMITGLGYTFEGNTLAKRLLMKIARFLYRLALHLSGTVYFQNNDDRALFEKFAIIGKNIRIEKTNGTGVDLDFFAPSPILGDGIRFLLIGRLLQAKGIQEFCEAADSIKNKYPQVEFSILGPEEHGAGAYSLDNLHYWENKGVVRYLGETNNVRPYLQNTTVVVLPSWREGMPCSLMEAMSCGRPVIAANAPGSREVVVDGSNGFLVPVKNSRALANAIELFILTPSLAQSMGKNARAFMENGFSADQVAQKIMDCMGLTV